MQSKSPWTTSELSELEASVPELLDIAQRLEMLHSAISANLDVVERRHKAVNAVSGHRAQTIEAASRHLLMRTTCLEQRIKSALDFVSNVLSSSAVADSWPGQSFLGY